jgi:hypothetical protein
MKKKRLVIKPTPEINERLGRIGYRIMAPNVMRRLSPLGLNDPADGKRELERKDLHPRESDILLIRARATSRDLIDNGFIVMDFTRPGVLEQSVPFYSPRGEKRVILTVEHQWGVSSVVGSVAEASFSAFDAGIDHAGVNVTARMDTRLNPKLARQVLGGAINAVSVADEFAVEISHPDMEPEEFWQNMGQEVDGEVVRIIVGETRRVFDVCLVGVGADPNARVLSLQWADGSPPEDFQETNGNSAGAGADEGGREAKRRRTFAPRPAATKTGDTPEGGAREQENQMDGITLDRLGAILGRDFAVPEDAEKFLREMRRQQEKLAEENKVLQEQAAELKPKAEAGEKFLETLRAEVRKAAELLYHGRGQKCPDSVLEQIKTADVELLRALAEAYGAKLEAAVTIPPELKRSSQPTPPDEGRDKETAPENEAVKRLHP